MIKLNVNMTAMRSFILFIIFCLTPLGVYAMGLLSKVMFSEVQGIVLQNGKPVAGAMVKRKFHWAANGDRQEEQVTTDSTGKFSFPLISRLSILRSILPHEPVIYQDILINFDGKEYIAWRFTKHDYDENGELNQKINLNCEITREKGNHINRDILGISKLK